MSMPSPAVTIPCARFPGTWILLLVLSFLHPTTLAGQQEREPWHIAGENLEGIVGGRSRLEMVEITHGGLRATALEGIWDPQEQLVTLKGMVRIRDSTRTMTSDSATYNRRTRVLIMEGDVAGEGPEGRLGGRRLLYRRRDEWVRVTGDAWLADERQRVDADSLVYDQASGKGRALGNVVLTDMADSTRATGDIGLLDRREESLVLVARPPGRPRMTRPASEGEPPVVVEADTLMMNQQEDRAVALGNVVVQQGRMGATGGRARFFREQDRMELLDDPRAWDPDGAMAGDTLRLVFGPNGPERLLVLGRASAEYLPAERPGEETFAIGDTLVAHFDERRLQRLDVRSQAQSLFIPSITDREQNVGKNWSQSKFLAVNFAGGRAVRVLMQGDAAGVYT
ncbi:MAG: hypothetical protein GF355_10965, partial [Candidatus Eisenbacteria bacterium]|nr:hypothetical protein [Candidatus Eisenbacteria bacterium]